MEAGRLFLLWRQGAFFVVEAGRGFFGGGKARVFLCGGGACCCFGADATEAGRAVFMLWRLGAFFWAAEAGRVENSEKVVDSEQNSDDILWPALPRAENSVKVSDFE